MVSRKGAKKAKRQRFGFHAEEQRGKEAKDIWTGAYFKKAKERDDIMTTIMARKGAEFGKIWTGAHFKKTKETDGIMVTILIN
ncbi:hypothetical protein SAMN05660909_03093 [Chitinophaga terrae (ex Kim and Jung 2007)]|uniref:Uncharacterized protein n=1 Tax=Chitinophaga terrae (ex Kim and Jung 2007) TaxID=408074 RepID=A0A1H4DG47_9BACT|nr:hypothetical protein [Chitinophaga terrae (ex Kim and Jung 2007)]SEA71232.1 hypothetical protein SAMN05660909_03093 [Chitinophaga terrae (ex Kim and Jung 2007)]